MERGNVARNPKYIRYINIYLNICGKHRHRFKSLNI